MNRLQAAIILISMVIGISAMSVGYALWSKTLTITGTVNTGSVEAAWSLHNPSGGTLGYDTDDSTPESCPQADPTCKNVSSVSCAINGDTLEATVSDAYPGIDYYCNIDITSTGTVPIHIENIDYDDPTVTSTAGTMLDPNYVVFEVYDDTSIGGNNAGYDGGSGDLLICEQLHLDDSAYGKLHIRFDNESNVQPGDTVHVGAGITLVQWNESNCDVCRNNHAPTVDVYIPLDGSIWYVGQDVPITWHMDDTDGITPAGSPLPSGPLDVVIDLDSHSGADGYPCRLASLTIPPDRPVSDPYVYTWHVPSDVSGICPGYPGNYHISTHNRIRVTVTDPCDGVAVDSTGDFCPLEACPVEGCTE